MFLTMQKVFSTLHEQIGQDCHRHHNDDEHTGSKAREFLDPVMLLFRLWFYCRSRFWLGLRLWFWFYYRLRFWFYDRIWFGLYDRFWFRFYGKIWFLCWNLFGDRFFGDRFFSGRFLIGRRFFCRSGDRDYDRFEE